MSFDINFYIYLFEQNSSPPQWQRHQFKWKDIVAI